MSLRLTYVLSVLFVISTFLSCKKDRQSTSGSVTQQPATVYVLGVQDGAVVFWKDKQFNPVYGELGVLYNFGSSSLTTSGNNVYIAGFQVTNTSQLFPYAPAFWLNGTATSLADTTGSVGNGTANAIAVSGSDVYVAGIRGYDSQQDGIPYTSDSAAYPITGSVATVWKNGAPVTLPGYGSVGRVDSGKFANRFFNDYVSALYVSGSDVYVAGGTYYQSAGHARFWKNGVPVDLAGQLDYATQNNTFGFPNSTGISVSGANVYVSGVQQTELGTLAIYWKNGSPVFLSTDSASGSVANSIFVSGSDVFVVGWQNVGNYSRAMLWKNGTPTQLTSGDVSSSATSVVVVGSDIYVAGFSWVAPGNYVAAYWKNGSINQLANSSSSSTAYSISVE
jgi:hypothetical protein